LAVLPKWLSFNRVTARLRQGYEIGPARLLVRFVLITFLYGAGSKKYHELNPCIELALTVFLVLLLSL